MSRPRLCRTPFALSSDGTLLLNLASGLTTDDLAELLRAAAAEHRTLFIGVVLDNAERQKVLNRLDNAGAEAAALITGAAPRTTKRPAAIRRHRATSTHNAARRPSSKSEQ